MFGTKKWKLKSLTNSRDFYPDPPINEKLKSSVLDHSDHLCIFMEKKHFFIQQKLWKLGRSPPMMENFITFNFFLNLPLVRAIDL